MGSVLRSVWLILFVLFLSQAVCKKDPKGKKKNPNKLSQVLIAINRKLKRLNKSFLTLDQSWDQRLDRMESDVQDLNDKMDRLLSNFYGRTSGTPVMSPITVPTVKTTPEDSDQTTTSPTTPNYNDTHCRPGVVDVPLCREFMPDLVHIPGLMGHQNIESAALEIHQFYPLVKVQCSPHLARFLCWSYFPKCVPELSGPIGPCRDLCEEARTGCQSLLNKFGFEWPSGLECSRFPAPGERQCLGV